MKLMKGGSYHKKSIIEEHILLISDPGSNYVGHVSVILGNPKCISKAI